MQTNHVLIAVAVAALLAVGGWLLLSGGGAKAPQPEVVYGEQGVLGAGTVQAWERWGANGALEAVGITVSQDALDSLPAEAMPLSLRFPQRDARTPFVHAYFEWSPHGHEPDGVYTVPHFDFHFYLVPDADREAVAAGPDGVEVEARFAPPGYFSTVEAVPAMGVHWIDEATPEFNGGAFGQTFIYGYYQGRLTFLEPMVTLDFLQANDSASFAIKQPQALQRRGVYFPGRYTIAHDADAGVYHVVLDRMRLH